MMIRSYLPSAPFAALVAALAVSGGVIYSAFVLTSPQQKTGALATDNSGSGNATAAWKTQFPSNDAVESAASISAKAQALIQGAKTNNLTETVGRALLISTAAAGGQGLGADQPTQDSIVAQALSQVQSTQNASSFTYTGADMHAVPDGTTSFHTYGNALVSAISAHPEASYNTTMIAVGLAVDNNNKASLVTLSNIAASYRALAKDVVNLPTPQTFLSSALTLANDYLGMAKACEDMAFVLSDPVKGIAAMQQYTNLTAESAQIFAGIATSLQNAHVSFTAKEAGSAWSAFLATVQRTAAEASQTSTTQ